MSRYGANPDHLWWSYASWGFEPNSIWLRRPLLGTHALISFRQETLKPERKESPFTAIPPLARRIT